MREKFKFKKFHIFQDYCQRKINTDSVLLGAWCKHENTNKILDIGCGTGVVGLMTAQRFENAQITLIDVDDLCYQQAKENVEITKWKNRMKVEKDFFQNFAVKTFDFFNLIVSNPPFFTNSLKSNDESKNLARHDDTLPLLDLFSYSKTILDDHGALCVIYPYNAYEYLIETAETAGFCLSEVVKIKSVKNLPFLRVLAKFELKICTLVEKELSIYKDFNNKFTDEYIALTEDFYLNM